MTSMPDVPDFRLYTSAEGAAIVRGGEDVEKNHITAATLDNLARSGRVKCTMIGRKRRWTMAQLAAVVAACETSGGEEAKASAPAPRERMTPTPERRHGSVAPFVAKPGSRYAAAR